MELTVALILSGLAFVISLIFAFTSDYISRQQQKQLDTLQSMLIDALAGVEGLKRSTHTVQYTPFTANDLSQFPGLSGKGPTAYSAADDPLAAVKDFEATANSLGVY